VDNRNDPIEFSHEDQLGRASTAKVFAKALLANPRRPMIVAVFGPWGSGKTSFANLLSADLRQSSANCVWFNPWQFTNSEAMTLAFFDLLATSLAKHKDADYHAVRETFFRYAEGITSLSLVPSQSVQTRGRKTFKAPADAQGVLSQPSLVEQRDTLTRHFGASAKPLVVFIDDIDRLFAAEIRLLIQLVKSNADFPNLKFVLLFQKETVEAALKTDGQSGGDFLEKIIEVPIELPLIRGTRYVNELLNEVADIFGDLADLSARDNDRWQYLLQIGILKRFTTLRQKNRLIDRLHLHKWNIDNSLGIDINLVDLVALEILRFIDYDVYNALRKHGHALTEAGDDTRYLNYEKDPGPLFLADVLNDAGEGDHETARAILLELFPCFGGGRFQSNSRDDERGARICRSRHFPKYFFEGLQQNEMSRAARRRLEDQALKGEVIYEILCAFQERGLLFDALEYLRAVSAQVPAEHWKKVATDLGRIADAHGRKRDKAFDRSVVKEIEGIVMEMLASSGPEDRLGVLKTLVNLPDSIQLAASLLASPWFDSEGASRFTPKLARSIAKAAQDGQLESFEQYGFLLYRWKDWGGGRAAAFVRGLASDPVRFTQFARAIAPYSQHESGIALTARTKYIASAKGVLEFLPKRTAIGSTSQAVKAMEGQKDEAFLKKLLEELRKPQEIVELPFDDVLEDAAVGR
jgi:hypothetical protein